MAGRSVSDDASPTPVYVIESVPVGGAHEVSAEQAMTEGIPLPAHLRIYAELARGAMGRIHPATDRNLLRHVALKRLDKTFAAEPFYRDGFIAEAQITGQLEHPNIVPVHELRTGEAGGENETGESVAVPYFTMKLVQGTSLHRWLRDPRFPLGSTERLEQGLDIFVKVCDAVAYAHHRGVIHRDIKPDNIMVASFGQVYVMDWGLARLTRTRPASGDASQMDAPGPVGTPGYMPPEQARGNPDEMDERSDVFGLGAVLYEIVSGKMPFGGGRDAALTIQRAKAGAVVPIDEAAAGIGVSSRLRAIVARATAPHADDRYPTVVELQRDVVSFLRGGLHLPRRVYPPGSIIIREGETGDAAYMIVSGRCRAYRTVHADATDAPAASERRETLAIMAAGDVFGEMALLLDEPRAATVEAVDSVTVLVLDKATMTEGLGVGGWTGALVRALAQRFRDLEQQVRSSGLRRR
jgi:eukaryotic-like serine/threonine-protein kinase